MEKDYKELDKLFKNAFERVAEKAPDENIAWKKFQATRNKITIFSLIVPSLLITLIGFFYVSVHFNSNEEYFHIFPPIHNTNVENKKQPDNNINQQNLPNETIKFTEKNTRKVQKDKNNLSNKKIAEIKHLHEENLPLRPLSNIPAVTEQQKSIKDLSEAVHNNSDLREFFSGIETNEKKTGKNVLINLSVAYMLHNHFIDGGNFMGGNHPGIGLHLSGILKRNLRWSSGLRYVHRGNQDLNIFTKTREVYDIEQINIYTLYVRSTYWLEIPFGIQYHLKNSRAYFGGSLTTDILLHQSAILGLKTQIPTLNIETEERRKKASNYDAGIPRINPGLRAEIGWILGEKNSVEIFTKISPYGGVNNANISRKYGLDIGVEWKYYF